MPTESCGFPTVNSSRNADMLSLRTLLRHPIQFAIMTLGIALGAAVMVGIDIANASAARAFDLSTAIVLSSPRDRSTGSATVAWSMCVIR